MEYVLLITHADGTEGWLHGNKLAVESEIARLRKADPTVRLTVIRGKELGFALHTFTTTVCKLED